MFRVAVDKTENNVLGRIKIMNIYILFMGITSIAQWVRIRVQGLFSV